MSTMPGLTETGPPPRVASPHVTLPDPSLAETPSDHDDALARFVRELFFRARSHRRPIIATWNRNKRLLQNRTWLSDRVAWLPSPEVPEIRPIISQLAGWMTDQRPTYEAVPSASPHTPYYQSIATVARDLGLVIDSTATVHGHESQIKMAVWDSFSYGTGLLKSGWDMALDGGLGNAVLQRVDPYSFYPDPQATNEHDGNYYIEAHNMSVQEVDRRWRAGKLFPQGNLLEEIDERPSRLNPPPRARTFPGQIAPISPSTHSPQNPTNSLSNPDPNERGVTVLECWLREHKVITLDGEETVFDYWRVVVVVGNRVLMDEPAYDLWSHGKHPYHRFVADDEGEFWGQSLVEDLASCQITLNRMLSGIQHNIELTGNPPFMESSRSGLQRTRVPNRPGTRLTVSDITQAKWMDVPALHQILPLLIQFYVTEMERVSGLSAINRGFTPTGRNASDVLDSVQEAGFTRIRSHLRSLEWALRSAYDQIACLITENFTAPRIVAIVGDSGQNTAMALNARHFHVPARDPDGKVTQYPLRFTIISHIGAHVSQQQRRAEAIQLFTLGAYDHQALLSELDIPDAAEIASRIARLQAAGAFQPPGARQRAGH